MPNKEPPVRLLLGSPGQRSIREQIKCIHESRYEAFWRHTNGESVITEMCWQCSKVICYWWYRPYRKRKRVGIGPSGELFRPGSLRVDVERYREMLIPKKESA